MANSTSYQPPIDKLLTLGSKQLNDVAELGFSSEHIPDLIKMAIDNELLGASDDNFSWAPVHAWRILGQLQATEAITPLIQLFQYKDNDLVNEELPKILGKIGNAAIPELTKYLNSQENQLLARVTAINSLEEIAQQTGARSEVINVLAQSLQSCNQNPSELNGFIVSALINLQAREAAPQIKYAFNTNQVAEDIVGDWEEVRESLGINSDEEVEEYQPQALQQLAETNIEAEKATLEEEQQRQEELNALIDIVAETAEIETQTQENTLPTTELASEIIDTETSTEENTLPTTELATEDTETETSTEENTLPTTELGIEDTETETSTEENRLPKTELASEDTETETSAEENAPPTIELASEITETETQENALPTIELASEVNITEPPTGETASSTTELASELANIEIQAQENALATSDNASQLVETETSTEENVLPTPDNASETNNTNLVSGEPQLQQEIIYTQENLVSEIHKLEDEIEEVASEIEASEKTQVTVEASTQTDDSHEKTEDKSTEAISVESSEESSEELNPLEQEDIKGFGRPATTKEKTEKPQKGKPSKKKKRGFSDL